MVGETTAIRQMAPLFRNKLWDFWSPHLAPSNPNQILHRERHCTEAHMAARNFSEHARVTAICVNLALDTVEADIRRELDQAGDDAAKVLRRILAQLRAHRVTNSEIKPLGSC
jgi:hypothetical protein